MRGPLLPTLLLCALAAGCVTTPVDTPQYALEGAFNERATPDTLAEVEALAQARTSDHGYVIERTSPDLRIHRLTSADCEALHEALRDKPYLMRLDACRPEHAPSPSTALA